MKIGHKVDHIDGIADKKSYGAGYTSSRSTGKKLNFLIFFVDRFWSTGADTILTHLPTFLTQEKSAQAVAFILTQVPGPFRAVHTLLC